MIYDLVSNRRGYFRIDGWNLRRRKLNAVILTERNRRADFANGKHRKFFPGFEKISGPGLIDK